MKKFYEKGLSFVYLGVESGDDDVLKFIKKGIKVEKIVEFFKKIMSIGIDLLIILIVGFLGKY